MTNSQYSFILCQGDIIKNKIYIIGAGLSGLSSSIYSLKKNFDVELYESSNFAGGRCRSFYDKKVHTEIDNGNHLVFSANKSFKKFCDEIESTKTINIIPPKLFFYDNKFKKKWNIDLSNGLITTLFNYKNLIPNTKLIDYLSFLKFFFVKDSANVYDLVGNSKIYKTFWEPFTLGVMNTCPKVASAKVVSNVLKETIFKGEKNCFILQPKKNWNETLIKPSLIKIKKKGGKIFFKNTLRQVNFKNNQITELVFNKKTVKLKKNDRVIFAIPPSNLMKFLVHLKLPVKYNTILNIHYKVDKKTLDLFDNKITGFINTISQWLFVKNDHISVTVSNANSYNNTNPQLLANKVWKEISNFVKRKIKFTDFQIVREKKATYIQSPQNIRLVKNLKINPCNFFLAGDWTQYNLPCTIEASILSGKKVINSVD